MFILCLPSLPQHGEISPLLLTSWSCWETHRSTFLWFLFVYSSSWFPHFDKSPHQGSKCWVVMHVQPIALPFLCFCQVQNVHLSLGSHRCMCADVFSRFITLDTQWLIYLDIYIFCKLDICMRFFEKLLHCKWVICLFVSVTYHTHIPQYCIDLTGWKVVPYKLGYINMGLGLW